MPSYLVGVQKTRTNVANFAANTVVQMSGPLGNVRGLVLIATTAQPVLYLHVQDVKSPTYMVEACTTIEPFTNPKGRTDIASISDTVSLLSERPTPTTDRPASHP